ncbi:MAG TPA: branched-chain amino acid transport system II carrier protein, partial [Firmicutes bacterium]|nr:branched-chain amino acid transport system II carrier protein [Bacillota bacterium]
MKNKQFKDSIVIGFALFAMFFGAGNLIFPPYLGNQVGDQYIFALLGFLITGVGLPLLGILACAKIDGTFDQMANRVGKRFSIFATVVLILAIGPMVAIPRTASTTYELGVSTLFPSVSQGVSTVGYFLIALAFVLKPTAIVDRIGKVLTPILLIVLATIIGKGIFFPIGELVPTGVTNVFPNALTEGYQTMDAMAAVIFASIIISAVKAKGYKDGRESTKVIMSAGVIAIAGLGLIYGGLMFLGSQTANTLSDVSRTQLVLHLSQSILGNLGTVLLSISVTVACLTTAIALLSSSSQFFTKLFKNTIPYHFIAIMLTVVSAIVATNDVDAIVSLAGPALDIIYPVVIVLIIITLLGKLVRNNSAVAWTVYVTLLISVLETVNNLTKQSVGVLDQVLSYLPLHEAGFSWVIPAVLTLGVT